MGVVLSVKLNDAELAQLRGLRPELFQLYVMLRKRMDYATGWVGRKHGCGVSWQGLREDMYIEPAPGVEGGSPSKEALRRMGAALCRAQLLRSESVGRRLMFFCSLADTDYSVKNKADIKPTYDPDTKGDISKNSKADIRPTQAKRCNGAGFSGSLDSKPDTAGNAKPDIVPDISKPAIADTPPVSGNKNLSLSGARVDGMSSVVSDEFYPEEWVAGRLSMAGCREFTPADVICFVSKMQSQERKSFNWSSEFVGWFVRVWRNEQSDKARFSSSQQRRPAGNAFDQIKEANREHGNEDEFGPIDITRL